jgi:hypothetical protein
MRARAIKLQDIKDGLATTMVTGAGNESKESVGSEGDRTSQRGILARDRGSKDVGIRVTQSYKVDKDRGDGVGVGGGLERRTEDMV